MASSLGVDHITALICEPFKGFETTKCHFYDSSQQAVPDNGDRSKTFSTAIHPAYFMPSEAHHSYYKKIFNTPPFDQLGADPNNLRFAVGHKIDQCYYFSSKDLDKIKNLTKEAVIESFNSHFGEIRSWEEACAATDRAQLPNEERQEGPPPLNTTKTQSAIWKLFVAALTLTGLGALLYVKRRSIQAWISGSGS